MSSDWAKKPYKSFPLYPHQSGYWAKKICGKVYYFGARYCHHDDALAEFSKQKDTLLAGLGRPEDGISIEHCCILFLEAKRKLVESGKLGDRSLKEYTRTCKAMSERFGRGTPMLSIGPRHWEKFLLEMSQRWGPVTVSNEVRRMKVVFKYLEEAEIIPRKVRCGPLFREASERTLRAARNMKPKAMFTGEQIRLMAAVGKSYLPAAIWLGINCAFGNTDVASVPLSAVDLQSAWINFPRPKTHTQRRCPLWPETVAAIQAWLVLRKKIRKESDLIFLTSHGEPICSFKDGSIRDAVGDAFRKLRKDVGITTEGVNFYALRKTFLTVAEETKDFPAVRVITGHAMQSNDVPGLYRQQVSDQRLLDVSNFVRHYVLK